MDSANVKERKLLPYIIGVSIVIPVVVAVLALSPKLELLSGFDLHILPFINAILNGTTSVVLVAGFFAIKNKNVKLHRRFMTSAIVLSVLFLVSYVLYHSSAPSTPYGGVGSLRTIYFTILISHILLAIVIVPLVLITFVRALSEKFDKHRKIARITLPLWLYVTVTGVIVYLMISPYYV